MKLGELGLGDQAELPPPPIDLNQIAAEQLVPMLREWFAARALREQRFRELDELEKKRIGLENRKLELQIEELERHNSDVH